MSLEEAVSAYREGGFARVCNVLDNSDLTALRDEWGRLWSEIRDGHPSVQWRGHLKETAKPDRLDAAYLLSPRLEALCHDRRITRVATAALGSPAVFFKDKLITKGSGTHGYDLHQDWAYWKEFGVPADDMVTLQIAIDSCDQENGALEVWCKEPHLLPAAPAGDPLDVDPSALRIKRGELMWLTAGDVLLLHPMVPHRSAANLSQRPRRSYFITYVSFKYTEAAFRREQDVISKLPSLL
jgi:2-aminoethylphosphonate dioxygenase